MSDMFGEDHDMDPEKALAAVGLPRTYRWHGTLQDMHSAVRLAMRKQRMEDAVIDRVAEAVVMQLCDTLGGQIIYLPRGVVIHRALRDARIYADSCRGMKPHELVRRYRLALQTIYDIIAQQTALARRTEPDLFGFDDTPRPSR